MMLRAFALLLAILSTVVPSRARADAKPNADGTQGLTKKDDAIVERYVTRAKALDLAHEVAWNRLLLYKRHIDGEVVSQVDGANFFLDPHGRNHPAAELEATLRAFFVPFVAGNEDLHALCRFPARKLWLESRLHFLADLPGPVTCPAFDRYQKDMDAESATFVYASNFVQNPASAFGHTFLRIKKKSDPAAAPESQTTVDLRDHGIDYTASTDTDNPLLYAYKGLTGLFPGLFRFRSYDAMLKDYAGHEARDLWEYELALSPSELESLVDHLWELTNTRLDYLYLTENCSYQIIASIDAAAPRLSLVDHVKRDVLPLDAVKAVQGSPGLVRSIVYRPSVRSTFRAAVAKLNGAERALVERLLEDPSTALPSTLSLARAAAVLDASILAFDSRFAKAVIDNQNAAVARRATLVERRARITAIPIPPAMKLAPIDKEPHKSHGTMRVVLGTGMTRQYDTGFATLGYRLALHDLADPPDGEPELLQLQFLDTRVRYDYGRRVFTLDALTFAEVVALNPISRFEKTLSWRARAFGMRLHDRAAPDSFAHGAELGMGVSFATSDEHLLLFAMADAYVGFSDRIDGIGGSFVRAGIGPLGGLRVRLPARTVALVTASMSYLPAQNLSTTFDVRGSLRSRLAKNVALGLEGAAQPLASELQLASYLYF